MLTFFNQQNDFYSVMVNTVTFRAPGMFYSLLFCLSAFMTGAPLVTNMILPLTLHLQTAKDLLCWQLLILTVLLEEVLPSWRPASRKPLDPSCFSSFDPSSYFAFCVLFRQMFTFAPLLIFKISMDPYGLPLQVINLTNKSIRAYRLSNEYAFDTVQDLSSDYGLAASLPNLHDTQWCPQTSVAARKLTTTREEPRST